MQISELIQSTESGYPQYGRSRYNVLGAINFASKKMTTITNDSYITSAQVAMLIDELLSEYPDRAIKLVLDNVRYQRCKNEIERLFRLLRGFRRIFCRFDKLDIMYGAFIMLAL